jgi:hypothetical protein
MLSAKRFKRSANEKIGFGNVWELQILAAVIGSPSASGQRLEKKQGAISQSEVGGFRDGKPTRMRRVLQALQCHFGSSCLTLPLSLMQQLRGSDQPGPN